MNGGLIEPCQAPTGVDNNDLQARGIEAYLSMLYENKGTWLKGVSIWEIDPFFMTSEGLSSYWYTQGFMVYKKPAAEVIKKYFTLP